MNKFTHVVVSLYRERRDVTSASSASASGMGSAGAVTPIPKDHASDRERAGSVHGSERGGVEERAFPRSTNILKP